MYVIRHIHLYIHLCWQQVENIFICITIKSFNLELFIKKFKHIYKFLYLRVLNEKFFKRKIKKPIAI